MYISRSLQQLQRQSDFQLLLILEEQKEITFTHFLPHKQHRLKFKTDIWKNYTITFFILK